MLIRRQRGALGLQILLQLLVLGEQLLVRGVVQLGQVLGLLGHRVVRVLLHGQGCLSRVLTVAYLRLELVVQQMLVRVGLVHRRKLHLLAVGAVALVDCRRLHRLLGHVAGVGLHRHLRLLLLHGHSLHVV